MRWPGSWDWEWEGTAERGELGRDWSDDECTVCAISRHEICRITCSALLVLRPIEPKAKEEEVGAEIFGCVHGR